MKTARDILKSKSPEVYSVSADTIIRDALQIMNENHVGSVLVKDGEKIIGIWTDQELVKDLLAEGFDIDTSKIGDYMIAKIEWAPASDSIYHLMDRLLGLRMRRILVELEGEFIGILSSGDIMKACLMEKDSELKELNSIVSWEYYEDWMHTNKTDD